MSNKNLKLLILIVLLWIVVGYGLYLVLIKEPSNQHHQKVSLQTKSVLKPVVVPVRSSHMVANKNLHTIANLPPVSSYDISSDKAIKHTRDVIAHFQNNHKKYKVCDTFTEMFNN